ncbi:craniofacial development protein 2-like [Schistocerca nitens]|uniref:craniofacial development protein 2-like n=1 Tax=Schistocerca nitens TaxID=7011 RepID=UPI002119031D|nr:craniofacial development protein 2-like [Schistocerca nitens]
MAVFNTKFSGVSSPPVRSPGGTVLSNAVTKKRLSLKDSINACNVKMMAQAGKISNAIQEMESMSIKIMGISEMRWPGSGSCNIKEHRIYYSGTCNGQYKSGVGFIVLKAIAECVNNCVPVLERVILLQISTLPAQLNIIEVYAPTTDHSDEEVAECYSQISGVLQHLPKKDLTIIIEILMPK